MSITAERLMFRFPTSLEFNFKGSLAFSMVLHLGLVWCVSHQNLVIPMPKKPVDLVLSLESAPPKPQPLIQPPKPAKPKEQAPPERMIVKAVPVPAQKPLLPPRQPVPHFKIHGLPTPQKLLPIPTSVTNSPTLSLPAAPSVSSPVSHEVSPEVSHTPPAIAPAAAIATAEPSVSTVARPATPRSQAIPAWKGKVLGRLERCKRYPKSARELHQQGVAYLRFTMDRQGKLISSRIERSSGFEALDTETLALIQRANPLPPAPAEMVAERIELVVPIQFSLK